MWIRRIRYWLNSTKRGTELRTEMELHIEENAQELREQGRGESEARSEARRRFGNSLQKQEQSRDVWIVRYLSDCSQDLWYALRQLRRSPAFTAVAVLTLAIGIGACTATFSEFNAVFLQKLPVREPQSLRSLNWTSPKVKDPDGALYFNYPVYSKLRAGSAAFAGLAAWFPVQLNATPIGHLEAQFVSDNYFETLGVSAIVGRTLGTADDQSGAVPVAVISNNLWRRAYGGDPNVLNQIVEISGTRFSIVGVLPQGFFGLDPGQVPDLFAPLETALSVTASQALLYQMRARNRDELLGEMFGRIRQGVSDEQASVELNVLLRDAMPTDNPKIMMSEMDRGLDTVRRATVLPVRIMMIVVAITLLIGCSNIASLLLARGAAREKEIASRLALGASRGRLVRQLLAESSLVGVLGGVLGVALSFGLLRAAPHLLTQFVKTPLGTIGELGLQPVPDLRILAFAALLIGATTLLFGLIPALKATKVDLISVIKQVSASQQRTPFFPVGKTLISVQVALALLLLVGAGLFLRTLYLMQREPLGLQTNRVLVFRADPGLSGYSFVQIRNVFESAIHQLEGVPGIVVASGSVSTPLGASPTSTVCVEGAITSDEDNFVNMNTVLPRFFETWNTPLLAGRDIDWRDRIDSPPVAMVNETFARKYFGDSNPIGRIFRSVDCRQERRIKTIVGVVADSKADMRGSVKPTIYTPYFQYSAPGLLSFVVRTSLDPGSVAIAVHQTMAAVDPRVPIFDEMTATDLRDRLMTQERVLTQLLTFFGAVALFLACLGIYGQLTYSVSRRVPEIGIRRALGATNTQVIGIILGESLFPVGVGIVIGLAAAWTFTRTLESLLFGVSQHDPWTIVAVCFLFVSTATAAAALPTLRATRLDPAKTLRLD